MLKKILFGVVAIAFAATASLPLQVAPAAAEALSCKAAAKMKYPSDSKARHAWKKDCKAAWKASQKA